MARATANTAPVGVVVLCGFAVGALVGACGSTSRGALAPIPALGHGTVGAALAPAVAFPAPGAVEYRLTGTLPALADHAVVYRAGSTATTARISRLATSLGLSVPVREDSSGWTVDDGNEQLRVERLGGLPWSLSTSGAGAVSSGCAVAVPGGTPSSAQSASPVPQPTCPPSTTVPGLPDQADAERRARDVLTQAGFDLTGASVQSSGSTSAWEVTFTPVLNGLVLLGGALSVAVGPQERIVSASGRLADPSAVGDYPLVGITTGMERLREGWNWIVYGGPVPLAAGVPASTSSSEPSATSVSAPSSPATGPPVTAPESTVPTTTTAPQVVTIVGVHLALSWAWPAAPTSADAWLVPVYVFMLKGHSPYPFLSEGVPVLAIANRYVTTTTTTAPTGTAVPGGAPSQP